jgi:exodeoxyribonuclease V alpha subunit
VPASTLHRLLEWRRPTASFSRNAARPLEADVLIVDEASMVDVRLGADLVGALPASTRLVLVGDVDQLPSVGPGTVLADVIASGAVPVVRLTEIFRQAAASLIVVNAHRIHDGDMPELGAGADRDFFFLEEDDPARAAALIRDLVATRLPPALPAGAPRDPGAVADAPGRAGRRQPEPAVAGGADDGRRGRASAARAACASATRSCR